MFPSAPAAPPVASINARALQLAGASLALLFAALAAHANVFVEDRRQQRDPTLPIFRSVGLLRQPETGAGGTAFLVGRCHVLTAHHVAFGKDPGSAAKAGNIVAKVGHTAEFLIGADPGVPARFAARTRARVIAFGNFSEGDYEGMAGDWAILRLDDCLGAKYGFLKLARPDRDRPLPEGELMAIGFPRSRAQQAGVTVERGCRARDRGPSAALVGVDCAFENGMSGGPVLERHGERGWIVIGLVQQSLGAVERVLPEYSMAHRNQVVYVSAFRQAVDTALRGEARRSLPAAVK